MKRTIRRRLEREKQKIITRLAPLIGGKEPKAGALNSGSPGVVAASGLRGDEWEELQRVIDVQNVQKMGFSPERFPTSCVQAYEQLCRTCHRDVDAAVRREVERAAQTVFQRDPILMPDAMKILSFLRGCGVRLALLTKGDLVVQNQRIESSKLRGMFDVIRIVKDKTPQSIVDVVSKLGTEIGITWMVGNSLRSDILPALEAGLQAIWIDAHVWEHERSHGQARADGAISLSSLSDVPPVVLSQFAQLAPDCNGVRHAADA